MYYYTPTKLLINEDIKNLGRIVKEYGFKHVLIVYGQNSVIKSGLLDEVKNSLRAENIEMFFAGGVRANPLASFVREVLARGEEYDLILAVGGGSVIDTAKSIAASYKKGVDPMDYNLGKIKPTSALPVGVVLTIAAAGSEMSDSCVLSDGENKAGFNSDINRPLFALTNPKFTVSVSKYQTACGITDIMMHTLERYLSVDTDDLADNLAIGLLQTVWKHGIIAYNHPDDLEARRQLLLSSSISHNGLTSIGKKYQFRLHKLEHVISGFYPEVAHGAGLAVCFSAYADLYGTNPSLFDKFLRLAYDVCGVEKTSDTTNDVLSGIKAFDNYFKEIGMPLTLRELGCNLEDIERFSLKATKNKTACIADFIDLDYDKVFELYKRMF